MRTEAEGLGDPRTVAAVQSFSADIGLACGRPDYWRAKSNWGDFCEQTAGDDFECR